jgi:FtsH-binding integral membrane protein
MQKMSSVTALLVFVLYSAVMGISLSWIFFRFTGGSILQTFIVSAALFAGLALFGAVTKADLTKLGNILMVALVVLVIAMIVNIFMGSSGLDMVICAVGVIIFAGLTAYDTQKIVQYGAAAEAGENANKMAIMGALNLYLDFINLFMFLLRLLGGRK